MGFREYAQLARCAGSLAFLVGVALCTSTCKKADTAAAEALSENGSRHERMHSAVVCMERLQSLAANKGSTLPWDELPLSRRIALCRGATSTAPIDCLLSSHEALTRLVQAKTTTVAQHARIFEYAARVCTGAGAKPQGAATCLEERLVAGDDLRAAALACRHKAPDVGQGAAAPACIARVSAGGADHAALARKGLTLSAVEASALCEGVSVPSRPGACLTMAPVSARDAQGREVLVTLCRGNDDPNAVACFREAVSKAGLGSVTERVESLAPLAAARLCARAE
jgi:hypothetical protein